MQKRREDVKRARTHALTHNTHLLLPFSFFYSSCYHYGRTKFLTSILASLLLLNYYLRKLNSTGKMTEETMEDEILRLYADGNWREILSGFGQNKFLPWIWPNEQNLNFIGRHLKGRNINRLASVGCGSGLLEWLLKMATGVEVTGIELNGVMWMTKYSFGGFVPLVLVDDPSAGTFSFDTRNSALLFCYFNDLKAFLRYLENYRGKCLIVIGPGPGRGTYTIPEPFRLPEQVANNWNLVDHQKMSSSKDFIAVYEKKN